MTITKHPQSKYFSVLFMDADGRRVCRSLKTTNRTLATKMGADLELAARQARAGTLTTDKGREIMNQILNASGNSTIDTRSTKEFFKTWLASKGRNKSKGTATRYAGTCKAFLASLGTLADKPISAIQPRHLEAYQTTLAAKGLAASTTRIEIKILRMVFTQAKKEGLIVTDPTAAVELDDSAAASKKPFSQAEIASLLRVASPDWKTCILLGAYAGLRLGDAVKLTWGAVDFTAGTLTLVPKKTERKRPEGITIPMHPTLAAHLEAIAGDTVGAISPKLAGKFSGGKTGLSRGFIEIMESAGIFRDAKKAKEGQARAVPSKSFHSLRHSFNTALHAAGVDEKTRMALSGHTTASVNRGYTHEQMQTLHDAIGKIGTKQP